MGSVIDDEVASELTFGTRTDVCWTGAARQPFMERSREVTAKIPINHSDDRAVE